MPIKADKRPPSSESRFERILDFSGGLNTSVHESLIDKSEAQIATNLSYDENGTLSPTKGASSFATGISTERITSIGRHVLEDGNKLFIASAGDALYSINPDVKVVWDTKAEWDSGTRLPDIGTTQQIDKLSNLTQLFGDRVYTDDASLWDASGTTPTVVTPTTPTPAPTYALSNKAISISSVAGTPPTPVPGYIGVPLSEIDITRYVYMIGFAEFTGAYHSDMGSPEIQGVLIDNFTTTPTVSVSNSSKVTYSSYNSFAPFRLLLTPTQMAAASADAHIGVRIYSPGGNYIPITGNVTALYAYYITSDEYTTLSSALPNSNFIPVTEFDMTKQQRIDLGYDRKGQWISETRDESNSIIASSARISYIGSLGTKGKIEIGTQTRSSLSTGYWGATYPITSEGLRTDPHYRYMRIVITLTDDAVITSLTYRAVSMQAPVVTKIKEGCTTGSKYSFASLNSWTVIANGRDVPLKWNGINAPSILSGDAPLLYAVVTHNNRIWGVDAEHPSSVHYSEPLDATDWSDSYNVISINPSDGDKITSLIVFGQNLVVIKEKSMYLITGNQSANFSVLPLDTETGSPGLYTACLADRYLAYISQDGVRLTDLNTSTLLTLKIDTLWRSIDHYALSNAVIAYKDRKLFVSLPDPRYTVGTPTWSFITTMWVYDFVHSAWSTIPYWSATCMLVDTEKYNNSSTIYAGTHLAGSIYKIYYNATSDELRNVNYITLEWKSKRFNFGYPERYKLFRSVYLDIVSAAYYSNLPMYVDLYVDGELKGTFTYTVPKVPSGLSIGSKYSLRILPPLYGAVLGKDIAVRVRGTINVQSLTIEYVLKGNAPGGDV